MFTYAQADHRVHLIDTPGFNDTNRSDADTLRILAAYLGASYANGGRIHGVILLQPISDDQMPGSSVRALSVIQAICGAAFCRHIAIATTMWPDSPDSPTTQTLRELEKKLEADFRYFGSFMAEGAHLFRHAEEGRRVSLDEQASARRIVEHLLREADVRPPPMLLMQRELLSELKPVIDTTAGKILGWDIRDKLGRLGDETASLQKSMRDLHSEEEALWRAKLEDIDATLCERLACQEAHLEALRNSLAWLRGQTSGDDVPRLAAEKQQLEALKTKQEAIVVRVEDEVSETRRTYDIFRGHSAGIIGGLASGVDATEGTSSIVTAPAGGLMCTLM